MNTHKCGERIYQGPGIGFSTCGNNAAYEHENKWFCKTHHPPTAKAKQDARNAVFDAKWAQDAAESEAKAAAQTEQKRRADCYPDLLAALIDLEKTSAIASMYADPRRIAARAAIAQAKAVKP